MRNKGSLLKELPILVIVALVVSLFIKSFLVQFFYIPSGSMENTLQIKDRVAVNKVPFISNNIKRGDVVVFRDPNNWLPEIIDYSTNPKTIKNSEEEHQTLVQEFRNEYLELLAAAGEDAFSAGLLFPAIPLWIERGIGVDIVEDFIQQLVI